MTIAVCLKCGSHQPFRRVSSMRAFASLKCGLGSEQFMNIYAMPGDLVKYLFSNKGDHFDIRNGLRYLEEGRTYTVDYTEPWSIHTNVFLKEVPGVSFNSVQFEDLTEPERPDSWSEVEALLMRVKHRRIMKQKIEQGITTPIHRCLYEFSLMYRFFFKYRDPKFARQRAMENLKGLYFKENSRKAEADHLLRSPIAKWGQHGNA